MLEEHCRVCMNQSYVVKRSEEKHLGSMIEYGGMPMSFIRDEILQQNGSMLKSFIHMKLQIIPKAQYGTIVIYCEKCFHTHGCGLMVYPYHWICFILGKREPIDALSYYSGWCKMSHICLCSNRCDINRTLVWKSKILGNYGMNLVVKEIGTIYKEWHTHSLTIR